MAIIHIWCSKVRNGDRGCPEAANFSKKVKRLGMSSKAMTQTDIDRQIVYCHKTSPSEH